MPTTTIKLLYTITETAQRAALADGIKAPLNQQIDLPASPELAVLASIDPDGSAEISLRRVQCDHSYGETLSPDRPAGAIRPWISTGVHSSTERIAEPSAEAVKCPRVLRDDADAMAWISELRAASAISREAAIAEAAKHMADEAAKKTQRLAQEEALVAAWLAHPDRRGWLDGGWPRLDSPEGATTIYGWPAGLREEFDRRLAVEAEAKAAKAAAAERAVIEKLERDTTARDAWIRAHGSDRLRKCLDLGMIETCAGIYRDERLAHDYPGWIVDCKETAEESDIRNPSLEALSALEEARKIDKGATLVKVRPKAGDYDDEPTTWREAIRIDDLPGITSTKVFYRLI
jgi:hypothetical protein